MLPLPRQNEVTALVGPSGGGKTTVSRLAARFWDIDRGKITIGGMDISKVEPETLLSLYAIVFQDVTLFDNTIMENIRIGRKDASDEEVLAAAGMQTAKNLQKNCRRAGIPGSARTAVPFPEENGSAFPLPGRF